MKYFNTTKNSQHIEMSSGSVSIRPGRYMDIDEKSIIKSEKGRIKKFFATGDDADKIINKGKDKKVADAPASQGRGTPSQNGQSGGSR